MIDKPMKHADVCSFLNDTYKRKNHDYGDSFAQLRGRLPNAILIRLYDKYLRLETLLNGSTQEVKDESISDTLMDMANYCIMELVERGIDESKKTSCAVGATHKPTQSEYEELFAEDKPVTYGKTISCNTDVNCGIGGKAHVEPVKGKYEGWSEKELKGAVCHGNKCEECPIPNRFGKIYFEDGCPEWIYQNPEEFRKIAIAYLEGLEGKA